MTRYGVLLCINTPRAVKLFYKRVKLQIMPMYRYVRDVVSYQPKPRPNPTLNKGLPSFDVFGHRHLRAWTKGWQASVHVTSVKNPVVSMLDSPRRMHGCKSCLNSFGSTRLKVGQMHGKVTSTRPAFPRGKSPCSRPGACKSNAKTIKRIRSMLRGSISEMLKDASTS